MKYASFIFVDSMAGRLAFDNACDLLKRQYASQDATGGRVEMRVFHTNGDDRNFLSGVTFAIDQLSKK